MGKSIVVGFLGVLLMACGGGAGGPDGQPRIDGGGPPGMLLEAGPIEASSPGLPPPSPTSSTPKPSPAPTTTAPHPATPVDAGVGLDAGGPTIDDAGVPTQQAKDAEPDVDAAPGVTTVRVVCFVDGGTAGGPTTYTCDSALTLWYWPQGDAGPQQVCGLQNGPTKPVVTCPVGAPCSVFYAGSGTCQ